MEGTLNTGKNLQEATRDDRRTPFYGPTVLTPHPTSDPSSLSFVRGYPSCPGCAKVIVAEIEVSQRWALQ